MSTLSTEDQNVSVDARNARLDDGGKLRFLQGAATIVDIPLAATAFDAAINGTATARGGDGTNPVSASNLLSGTTVGTTTGDGIDAYQFLTAGDVVTRSGVIPPPPESGDAISLATRTPGVGVEVQITSLTHSQPAGV